MKPNRRIVSIAVAVIAIAGAWSARKEGRSSCTGGTCPLPIPPGNKAPMTKSPAAFASTNVTPQPATGTLRVNSQ
jgi:hypothetical protein